MEVAGTFKRKNSREARTALSTKMRVLYPKHTAVLVERRSVRDPINTKGRYLVPSEMSCGELQQLVTSNLKPGSLHPDEALFFTCQSQLLTPSVLVSTLAATQKDADGFLYIVYSTENVFGNVSTW
jgi:GABA(A) receptor-associated protein